MRDFTLASYRELLHALLKANLPVFGVARWLEQNPDRGALIRHDVDRRPPTLARL